jgi:hypothetical protein
MHDQRRLTGLLLLGGGLLWLLAVATDLDGAYVVPAIGLGFLAAYVVTRRYGLLVPAGILAGLGAGLVVAASGGPEGAVVLGLGLGFVSIAVLDALLGEGDAAWWPLIPGGILTVVGGGQLPAIRDVGVYLVPGALVVVGLALLLRPRRPRRAAPTTAAGDPGHEPEVPSWERSAPPATVGTDRGRSGDTPSR